MSAQGGGDDTQKTAHEMSIGSAQDSIPQATTVGDDADMADLQKRTDHLNITSDDDGGGIANHAKFAFTFTPAYPSKIASITDSTPTSDKKESTLNADDRGFTSLRGTGLEPYSDVVQFAMRPDGRLFVVHRHVLEARWPNWESHVIPMPQAHEDGRHHRPRYMLGATERHRADDLFQIFVVWLYEGAVVKLPSNLSGVPDEPKKYRDAVRLMCRSMDALHIFATANFVADIQLVRLYELALQLDVPLLNKEVEVAVAAQNHYYKCTTARGAVWAAYESPLRTGALKSLMVDEVVMRMPGHQVSDEFHTYPPPFIIDVLRHAVEQLRSTGPKLDDDGWIVNVLNARGYKHWFLKGAADEQDLRKWKPDPGFHPEVHEQYGNVVRIIVGSEEAEFLVHEQQICTDSNFFTTAFRGPFAEGQSKTLTLQDERVDIFAAFLRWSYSAKLEPGPRCPPNLTTTKDRAEFLTYLVDLFIFADRRNVAQLRNHIMDEIVERRESGYPLVANRARIEAACGNLPSTSVLCRYLAQEAAYCWDADSRELREAENLPSDFTAQVMRVQFKKTEKGDRSMPLWRTDPCAFHEHHDEEERARCQKDAEDLLQTWKEKGTVMEPVQK